MNELYDQAANLIKQDRNGEATKLLLDLLDENIDDTQALYQLSIIFLKEDRKGLAYNLLSRACKLAPEDPELWLSYSRAHKDRPDQWGRIEWCLKKSIKLYAKQKRSAASAYSNMAMLHYIRGELNEAQKCITKAFDEDSTNQNALVTQGFVHLAKGEWAKAWHLYDIMLQTGKRQSCSYGDEPEWDGTTGKRIVISGEQGLGDELMYASCFYEVIRDSEEVVIDCMPRLKNLFQRSFPGAKVYGHRWAKEVVWEEDHKPDYHTAMASIPRFYRNDKQDFPGVPYLKADEDMRTSFRSLLGSLGDKPKIGIAWTGGSERTRGYLRSRTLKEMSPILANDATFVSLEYHDRSEEIKEFKDKHGIEVHSFPWITNMGLDYDLTAALVAELDLVISVPTTAVQTAGALGIECWVMVPRYTGWIFAGDKYPWAASVTPLKEFSIKEVAEKLNAWLLTHSQVLKPKFQTG